MIKAIVALVLMFIGVVVTRRANSPPAANIGIVIFLCGVALLLAAIMLALLGKLQ